MTALQLPGYIAAAFAAQILVVITIANLRCGPKRASASNESSRLSATDGAGRTVAARMVKASAKKGLWARRTNYLQMHSSFWSAHT